jgi:predicted ATPase
MKVERIRLKNFKAFRDVTLEGISPYTVFVGANGVGKTTLFDVFGFLRDCLQENVGAALNKRGGFAEVITRGFETEKIEIELQVRMDITGTGRLVTYVVEIGLQGTSPIVEREILRYKRGPHGRPFQFLDFTRGSGDAITNESDFAKDTELEKEHQRLSSPQALAIKGLGQFDRFIAASAFRNLIENWHVSDFHIEDASRSRDAGYAEHLSPSGDNFPLVTQFLINNHPAQFEKIRKAMSARVPGVADVTAEPTSDARVVVKFTDGSFKNPFVARFVSDGTIKMFSYLVLLNDPNPHPLLCVEEPENQLYMSLLGQLSEEFETYSGKGGQVFVSTHSPDFLNHVPLESIFILSKSQGFSTVRKASDDTNISSLVKGGDLPGYLWRQGVFTGADP